MNKRLFFIISCLISCIFLYAQRYIGHETYGSKVSIRNDLGAIELVAYNDNIIKVSQLPASGAEKERRSVSVVAQPAGVFEVSEDKENVFLRTNTTLVTVSKSDCRLSFSDRNGKIYLAERRGIDNSRKEKGVAFAPMSDVAFYGGGYNGTSTNVDGLTLVMNNQPQYGWEMGREGSLNLNIPFIVSTNGYGILFDNQYMGAVIRPSSRYGTEYSSQSPSPIVYYYIGGNGSVASVMDHYTRLTGRQPLPAYWALGYVTSRYGYFSRQETEKVVSDIQSIDFPIDGVVLDLYWQVDTTSQMGDLEWFLPRWPQPEKMTEGLLRKGVHTVVISEPYVTSRSKNYRELHDKGWLADDSVEQMAWLEADPVGMIDITHPNARQWLWSRYRTVARQGVTGWWLDLGEPEKDDSSTSYREGSREEVHNEYANRWMKMLYNGTRSEFPSFRPILMTRSGTAGMQRYGVMPWTGDIARSWKGLHAQIPAMINTGMSGVAYMGSDVGGFASDGTANAPLYLRWVQQAVFGAMLRTHSAVLPEPYHSCYDSIRDDVRRFVTLHYTYLPYTYNLSYENATLGMPPARPLSFYNATAMIANVTDEYLYGRDILVAPVVTDGTERSIVFPEGRWLDMNSTTMVYDGGTKADYSAPLSVLPYFARLGAIIPRYAQKSFTNTRDIETSRYSLLCVLDGEGCSEGYIFEDDHISPTSLSDRAYRITRCCARKTKNIHTITVTDEGQGFSTMSKKRTFEIEIPLWENAPKRITLSSGSKKQKLRNAPSLSHDDGSWWYDREGKTLHICVSMDDKDMSLSIVR